MKGQRGFTLVEILVGAAILGTVVTALIGSYTNIVQATMRNSADLEVLTDLSQAVLVIQKDLFMAQETDLAEGSREVTDVASVELSWYDYVSSWGGDSAGTYHISTYSMVGTELHRSHDTDGVVVDTIIGRDISYASFTETGRVVQAVITSTAPDPPYRSETFDISSYKRTLGAP